MFNFEQVIFLLKTAGITQLKVKFDEQYRDVEFDYVFRGVIGLQKFTFEEIENVLSIGSEQFDKEAPRFNPGGSADSPLDKRE